MNAFASLPRHPHSAVLLVVAACLPLIATAQDRPIPLAASTNPANTASPANSASFSYEVVSIKPIKIEAGMSLGGWFADDGFTLRGVSLETLVDQAYPIFTPDQVEGLPHDAMFENYTVQAKMDEETAARFQKLSRDQQIDTMRTMMQQVLADRFKLKVHKETRQMPIYNLVIAKKGPKFKETPEGQKGNNTGGFGEISGDNIEMKQISMMLSGSVRRLVIDKTGLTGNYTLSLKWNPLDGPNVSPEFANQFKGRPGIFDALEEQLGLKLEPAKGPVDVYVIDHIEQPSPD